MRNILVVVLLTACGATASPAAMPPPAPSASASATPTASVARTTSTTVAPTPGPHLRGTIPVPNGNDAFGPAFAKDGTSVVFAAGGRLHRFDTATLAEIDSRPVSRVARLSGVALVLHGVNEDAAFDVVTATRIVVDVPKGYDCSADSFSADASKVARNCVTKTEEFILVQVFYGP